MPQNELTRRLIESIQARGPMRFDTFMEAALFDPANGYYAAGKARIGRGGDFYTSVSVGAFFGRLLAKQFAEIWDRLGRPADFAIVEQGGNDGSFAADVCSGLQRDFPEAYAGLRYVLVEPFEALRVTQSAGVQEHASHIEWTPSLDSLTSWSGVHFSNEYADALPVRIFVRRAAAWLERYVGFGKSGSLEWKELSIDSDELEAIFEQLPAVAPEGYLAECRPLASSWISALAQKLERGLILISDYGFPRADLHAPWRTHGTLSCYSNHRRDEDPLTELGYKDITAHVDFTALALAGTAHGCEVAGFTDQHHFLVGVAETWLEQPDFLSAKELNAFRSLMHPENMGTQFKYLALAKGLDLPTPLAGFRHAGNGAAKLLAEGIGNFPSNP